jgi:hypothetical protein
VGFGSSLQLTATVLRANVENKDIPIAGALSAFSPFFGGSFAASIGQNVFRAALRRRLLQSVSSAETAAIIQAGARDGIEDVAEELKDVVVTAYSYAVRKPL